MASQLPRCNVCGKVILEYETKDGISIHRQMGYHSKHDGKELDLDLCPACFAQEMDGLHEHCEIELFK